MNAIRAAIAVLIALAVVAVTGCGGGEPLGKDSLTKRSEAVQSLAAEGALLAEDSAAGRSTRTYRRERSSELAKAAATLEKSLRSARTEPALRPELRRLRGLAVQVRVALARLGSASGDEQRVLARHLGAAAKASEDIGEGLA